MPFEQSKDRAPWYVRYMTYFVALVFIGSALLWLTHWLFQWP